MKEVSKFYWVEMSQDSASAIASACDTFSQLLSGKLDILEVVALNAYEKRMGKEADETVTEQIRNALKLVQFIGWDSTYGNPVNVHGTSQMSDTLCGVSEVLSYQLANDNVDGYAGARYPMQWNDKIPLCRIVRICSSVYNRKKQLALFPKEK